MKKITYIGWLDYENIGDEALLPANMKLFPDCELVYNNQHFESKITLFGGGTLFPRWPTWIMKNRYNYAVGIGVRCPSFWGSPKPWQIDILKAFDFRFIGVRGPRSKEILASYGIESKVTGDTALILEPNSYKSTEKGLIGINIAKLKGDKYVKGSDIWGSDEKHLLKVMTRVCVELEALGFRILLLPFYPEDIIYLEKITKSLKNFKMIRDLSNPIKILNEVSRCEVFIGQKLHSIVFSACCYVPFISLEYRPKCRDFTELLDFEDFTVRTDELDVEKILDLFKEIYRDRQQHSEDLYLKVNRQRNILRQTAEILQNDWNQLDTNWSTHDKMVQMVKQKILKKKLK